MIDKEFYKDKPLQFIDDYSGMGLWDFQREIIGQVVEMQDNKFIHPIAVVSLPRQNSKSTISALIALWILYCFDNQSILSVALDRESASIIHKIAQKIIHRNDELYAEVNKKWGRLGLTRNEIMLKDGNTWRIKSSDSDYSRGESPTLVCYDELGWSKDEGGLLDVLLASQGAQDNPLFLITSTVSPIKAGPLWDLFIEAESNSDILLIYKNDNLSPRITKEYLAREEKLLLPTAYAREHENKWGEGSNVFCTEDDYRLTQSKGNPLDDTSKVDTYCFVDLGWAHDETAIAICRKNKELNCFDIIYQEQFQGSRENNVIIQKVQESLQELIKRYHIKQVEVEAPQGLGLSQSLVGTKSTFLTPTAKSNQERWGKLYTTLKNHELRLPKDAKLRLQLITLLIEDNLSGWRVVDLPTIHNDRAVAVAGALYLAITNDTKPEIFLGTLNFSGKGYYGRLTKEEIDELEYEEDYKKYENPNNPI